MKKFMSIVLALALTGSMLVGCGSNNTSTDNPEPPKVEDQNEEQEVAEGAITKIGFGHVTSIGKSKDAEGENGPAAQVDSVLVAAAFDKDGKVVNVTIDTAQSKVGFDKDLQVTSDLTQKVKTKNELKDDYGMRKASSISKEWFEQAEALAEWMVGKTIDEIKAIELKDGKPVDADLVASVTVTVDGYIAAIEEAYKNSVEVTGAVKLGLGHGVSIAKSKSAEGDKGPVAQVDNSVAVVAFDADNKVAGTVIDHIQTKVEFDAEGKLATDKEGKFESKSQIKEGYGMKKASQIGKEWYEQAASLGEWMVGKTVDEIKNLKVKEVDANHKAVPDVPELTSSVTITVESNLEDVAEAYTNAK